MHSETSDVSTRSVRPWRQSLLRWGCWGSRHCRLLWYRLRSSLSVHGVPELQQPLHAVGRGRVTFTGRVTLGTVPPLQWRNVKTYIEAYGHRAYVCIGHNTHIDNGFAVVAKQASVLIGSNVRIGSGVHIFDTRHTLLRSQSGRTGAPTVQCQPVVVEDDVVIGAHVRICGGVTIRRGARIASHSVVTCDVPEHTVFAGRPAQLVSHVRPRSWLPRPHARHASLPRWA